MASLGLAECSRIPDLRKTWGNITEDTLQKSCAAWNWLQEYRSRKAADQDVHLTDSLFSKLVAVGTLLRHDNSTIMCLGNRTWAFLGMRVDMVRVDGDLCYALNRAPLEWFYICDPTAWSVIEYIPKRAPDTGIV